MSAYVIRRTSDGDGSKLYAWEISADRSQTDWGDQKGAFRFSDRSEAHRWTTRLGWYGYKNVKVVKLVPKRPESAFVEHMRTIIK